MTQERDLSWLDEDGDSDDAADSEEPEGESLDAEVTAEADEEAEGDEGTEESSGAVEDDPTGVQALLSYDPAAVDEDKEAADALFAAQQGEARRLGAVNLDPEPYVVPEPDGPYELAAQKASRMEPSQIEYFAQQLRDATEARQRAARAGSPGYDASGEPVETTPPLDITSLSSEDFRTLMEAVSRGGANPSRTPEGYSPQEWERLVDQTMGVER